MALPKILAVTALALSLSGAILGTSPATAAPVSATSDSKELRPLWSQDKKGAFNNGAKITTLNSANSGITLTHRAINAPTGVVAVLERYVSPGVWKTVAKVPVVKGVARVKFGTKAGSGIVVQGPKQTHSYRLSWTARKNHGPSYSPFVTVKSTPNEVVFNSKYPFGSKATVTAQPAGSKKMPLVSATNAGKLGLQVKVKGKWYLNKYMGVTKVSGSKKTYQPWLPPATGGSMLQWRLYAPATTQTAAQYGAVQTVKYAKTKTKLYDSALHKYGIVSSTDPGRSDISVSHGIGRTVQLQQKVGSQWKPVSSAKVGKAGVTKLRMPKIAHSKKANLRVYAPATAQYAAVTGNSRTVTGSDPRKYTGYLKAARDRMKSRCGTMTLQTSAPLFKGWAGRSIASENKALLVKGMSGSFLDYVAKHECAHRHQWRVADKNKGWADMQARLNKLHGTKGNLGVERSADCMTQLWNGSKKHSYYTKKCTTKQLAAAKKVWAGKMP